MGNKGESWGEGGFFFLDISEGHNIYCTVLEDV